MPLMDKKYYLLLDRQSPRVCMRENGGGRGREMGRTEENMVQVEHGREKCGPLTYMHRPKTVHSMNIGMH